MEQGHTCFDLFAGTCWPFYFAPCVEAERLPSGNLGNTWETSFIFILRGHLSLIDISKHLIKDAEMIMDVSVWNLSSCHAHSIRKIVSQLGWEV